MILEASWQLVEKNTPKQCRKVEEMGVQRDPKSEPKSIKKGPQNTLSLFYGCPWVPRASQGSLFDAFWLHVWLFSHVCFVDVGGYRLYILGVFFYHALSLFATLSGPPCHYRCISTNIFRKASTRRWRFSERVPFRESSERGRVREGEGHRL